MTRPFEAEPYEKDSSYSCAIRPAHCTAAHAIPCQTKLHVPNDTRHDHLLLLPRVLDGRVYLVHLGRKRVDIRMCSRHRVIATGDMRVERDLHVRLLAARPASRAEVLLNRGHVGERRSDRRFRIAAVGTHIARILILFSELLEVCV
jgi:hypothetical protein